MTGYSLNSACASPDFIATLVGRVVDKSADDPQVLFAVVSLTGLLDTFGLYSKYINAVAPGLGDYLKTRNMLARQLYQTTIEVAGVPASRLQGVISAFEQGEKS